MRKVILQNKFWLFLVILADAAVMIEELTKAYIMQEILDAAIGGSKSGFYEALLHTVFFLVLMFVAFAFQDVCKNRFIQKCIVTIKERWFSDIQNKQLCDYSEQDASGYISHFTVDVKMLEEDYLNNFLVALECMFNGIGSLVVILNIHYAFVVFVVITFWIPLFVNRLWGNKLKKVKLAAAERNRTFIENLKEMLMGFEVIKLFGISKQIELKFETQNLEQENRQFKARMVRDISSTSSGTVSVGLWMGSYLLGAFLTICGKITAGNVLNVAQLLNHVMTPLASISSCFTKMRAADEVYNNISVELERNSSGENETIKIEDAPQSIVFRNVGKRFNEQNIFKGVNLVLEKGKKYLLEGESGSGKSSLLKVILNNYSDYQGEVLIDGNDFRNMDKDSWYQWLSVVNQENFVFHDTVYNNITLFQDYDMQWLEQVIEMCGLRKFLEEHQNGLYFMIEEGGKNISGGERQRICLARALIRKPAVLILDEATSALNAEMAFEIEKNILEFKDMTVISISHRVFEGLREKYDTTFCVKKHKLHIS